MELAMDPMGQLSILDFFRKLFRRNAGRSEYKRRVRQINRDAEKLEGMQNVITRKLQGAVCELTVKGNPHYPGNETNMDLVNWLADQRRTEKLVLSYSYMKSILTVNEWDAFAAELGIEVGLWLLLD